MFVRYELYCDGEKQDVGLLMGVEELNIGNKQKEFLLKDFDENLKIPDFYLQKYPSRCVLAFFTEEGMLFFKKSIDSVVRKFNSQGLFQIVKVVIPENNQNIVYQDKYQVLVDEPKDSNITYL